MISVMQRYESLAMIRHLKASEGIFNDDDSDGKGVEDQERPFESYALCRGSSERILRMSSVSRPQVNPGELPDVPPSC